MSQTHDGTGASQRKPGFARRPAGISLMTPIGVVAGEVLLHLERHRSMTLRRLARELKWPVRLVMMGVGALIREGLIRGIQRDLEVILEPSGPIDRVASAS